jgi:hypothetical protein
MRTGLVVAALLAGTLLVPGASVGAAGESFVDAASDSKVAPDVTTVVVSNDDRGLITFRISVPNRSTLGTDDLIVIPIATDHPDLREGTRPDDGASFVLGLDMDGAFLFKWNGQTMTELTPAPRSLTGSFSGGLATLTISQEDIAPGFPDMSLPAGLRFYVLGLTFDGELPAGRDEAPDGDVGWSYKLSQAPRLTITNARAPTTVRPGQSLTVRLGLARADTGAPVSAGKVTCRARLGRMTLRGSGRLAAVTLRLGGTDLTSPRATCTWTVPRVPSTGTIRATMAVTSSAMTVTRAFSTRVR